MKQAKSIGIELPPNREEALIDVDTYESFFKPSICQDILKGNFTDFENIVGEPLREAEKEGVSAPTLNALYGILGDLQYITKRAKGAVTIPQTLEERDPSIDTASLLSHHGSLLFGMLEAFHPLLQK